MKITCTVEKGGCGQKFEMTAERLADYKRIAESGSLTGCPNAECSRTFQAADLVSLVAAVEKRSAPADPLPGFPLKKPIVPAGRRKNGATEGTNFREIAKRELDRAPTPEEILRVQRFFADNLEAGTDCPCCTRHAKRQYRPLGCGPARWLIEIVYLSDDGQAIHTGEIIKALKGNNVSGSDATSVLPLYGMIEPAKDPKEGVNPPPPSKARSKRTSGFWRPTKLGRAFALGKIKVPAKVVTCLGVPEAFEGDPVSIQDALGKKFNYDEIMGRVR